MGQIEKVHRAKMQYWNGWVGQLRSKSERKVVSRSMSKPFNDISIQSWLAPFLYSEWSQRPSDILCVGFQSALFKTSQYLSGQNLAHYFPTLGQGCLVSPIYCLMNWGGKSSVWLKDFGVHSKVKKSLIDIVWDKA